MSRKAPDWWLWSASVITGIGIIRLVILAVEISRGTDRPTQIGNIAILFGLLAVPGSVAIIGFLVVGHRARSATRVLSHANPNALLISAMRLLEMETTVASLAPGTKVPVFFLWQIDANKIRLWTQSSAPRLCFEMDSSGIIDTDQAAVPVGTGLSRGMCFVVRDKNGRKRQIPFIPHPPIKPWLRIPPAEITALVDTVKSILASGPVSPR